MFAPGTQVIKYVIKQRTNRCLSGRLKAVPGVVLEAEVAQNEIDYSLYYRYKVWIDKKIETLAESEIISLEEYLAKGNV